MLERLFTSKTRVRILELLLINSDKEFHLREIARRTKTTPIYVSKELVNLKKIGLVSAKRKANLILFNCNKNSPIFSEIKNIFIKTESFGSVIGNVLEDQNIKYALIYGSFARGEEKENSDIDLLIIGEIGETYLIRIIRELEKKLNREINYIIWSEKELLTKAEKKHSLLLDIVYKPVIMLKGDFNEFERLVKR